MRRAWGVASLVVVAATLLGWTALARAASYPTENPADPATYDPYFTEQWALRAVKAPDAWALSTGAGVRIGVVDTGADLAHEDLAGKVVAATGCVGADDIEAACLGSAQDDQGHGTHVAGLAAAVTDNGRGVASVAPGAALVVVKALSADGSGALQDVNAGIKWAVDHGARVVNLSLESAGGSVSKQPGQSLAEGVEYAWQHGAIPVIAAGNSTPSMFGPGGYAGIDAVIVGATGPSGELAWYSSPLNGAKWGLVAPGGDSRGPDGRASCAGALAAGCVVSTGWFAGRTNSYADDEGTSMAAPQVAGALALLLGRGLTPAAAVGRLLATADPVPCGAACHGLLDVAAAVGAPAGQSSAPITTTPQRPPATTVHPPPSPAPALASGSASASPVHAPPPPAPPAPSTSARPAASTGRVLSALPSRRSLPAPRAGRRALNPALVATAVLLLIGVAAEATAVAGRQRERAAG